MTVKEICSLLATGLLKTYISAFYGVLYLRTTKYSFFCVWSGRAPIIWVLGALNGIRCIMFQNANGFLIGKGNSNISQEMNIKYRLSCSDTTLFLQNDSIVILMCSSGKTCKCVELRFALTGKRSWISQIHTFTPTTISQLIDSYIWTDCYSPHYSTNVVTIYFCLNIAMFYQ